MADENGGNTDLIELLLADHREAEALLGQIGSDGVDQSALFDEIVPALVGHETAEEKVVYPEVRASVPGGDALADARLAEQEKAADLLAKMENMDRSSQEFAASFAHLRDEATAHAKSEEAGVFPKLRDALTRERRAELGRAYTSAKEHAPAHP
jgi:hemerythrin superfamily protein